MRDRTGALVANPQVWTENPAAEGVVGVVAGGMIKAPATLRVPTKEELEAARLTEVRRS